MTEEKIIETIIEHDQAIKSVAKAIDTLTEEAKSSNVKLDSIVVSMSKQELILEKITNIENRTKDSFNRVHGKIEEVKKIQDCGCTPLRLNKQSSDNLDTRVSKLEGSVVWVIRTIISALIAGAIGSIYWLARS